jgi:hypothetical protein
VLACLRRFAKPSKPKKNNKNKIMGGGDNPRLQKNFLKTPQ